MLGDLVRLLNFTVNSEIMLQTFLNTSGDILHSNIDYFVVKIKICKKVSFCLLSADFNIRYSVLWKWSTWCFIVFSANFLCNKALLVWKTEFISNVNLIAAFFKFKPLLKNLGCVKAYLPNPNNPLTTIKKPANNLWLAQLEFLPLLIV